MRKNPGRKQRRQRQRKPGDLNRRSTHVMRSKMGMATKQPVRPAEGRPAWYVRLWQRIRRVFRGH